MHYEETVVTEGQNGSTLDDLSNATPIQIVESFSNHFNVEDVIAKFSHWDSQIKPGIVAKIKEEQEKLDNGGLSRDSRKKVVIARNGARVELVLSDPRRFETRLFDDWLRQNNLMTPTMSRADENEARQDARRKMVSAVKSTEDYQMSGLYPFVVDFERSNKYFVIKALADYAMDLITGHGDKTEITLENRRKMLQTFMALIEEYSTVPFDLKMASMIFIEHSVEFAIRVARIQDEMLQHQLKMSAKLISMTPDVDQITYENGEK